MRDLNAITLNFRNISNLYPSIKNLFDYVLINIINKNYKYKNALALADYIKNIFFKFYL